MTSLINTERLSVRELTLADAAFIIDLLNSPGWLAFIGDRHVHTTEQAETYLTNGPLTSYRERGFGLYAVVLRAQQTVIGLCGLLQRDYLEHPDLGFAFLPGCQGKGYAFESAEAVLSLAKATLLLTQFSAITLPTNTASIRLLEKLGFTYHSPIYLPTTNEQLSRYDT